LYNEVMTKPRVMVNILHLGSVTTGLETTMVKWMKQYQDRYDFQLFFPTGRPIPNNRNRIVKRFLEGDWDFLCMFDDDNFPLKNPFSMLDRDKDVVAGCYPGADDRGVHFHVYDLDLDKQPKNVFKFVPPERREGLQKVDAIATGCMFIKRWVLQKMRDEKMIPFEDIFDEDGILVNNEDMAFCMKCRKLGIEVYADWGVICDHIKEISLLDVLRLIIEAAKTGKAVVSGA